MADSNYQLGLGLGMYFGKRSKDKTARAEAERIKGIQQQAYKAFEDGDYTTLRKITSTNPEMEEEFDKMYEFKNKETKANALETVARVKNAGEDPILIKKALVDRVKFVLANKGDPGNTLYALTEFNRGNEAPLRSEMGALDAIYGEGVAAEEDTRIYAKKNKDGSVRTIKDVKTGSEDEAQLISQGFQRGSSTVPARSSATERKDARTLKNVDRLTAEALEDPNAFSNRYKYRQDDDGALFIDENGMPQKLERFDKVVGKRTNMKAIKALGEQWDDATELKELFELPTVQKNLSKARSDGMWDKAKGKWNNSIEKWKQDKGISDNSNTATAIARIQKMASDERKTYMGTAVTETEMESAKAWMPSAGDTYETMVNKTNLVGKEAEQAFRRWIDIYSKDADMSPFYKAFGIKRFGEDEQSGPSAENYRWSEELQRFDESAGIKGNGFLGPIAMADGKGTATEMSRDNKIDGKNIQYPLLVPTLTNEEIVHVLMGEPQYSGEQKAKAHAIARRRAGRSPFMEEGKDQTEKRVIDTGRDANGKINAYKFADGEVIMVN